MKDLLEIERILNNAVVYGQDLGSPYWDNYYLGSWVSIGIIQGLYRGHIAIIEKKIETTIQG